MSGARSVELVQLPAAAIHALAAGDLTLASTVSEVVLTPYLVSHEAIGTWRHRSTQVVIDPPALAWITAVVHEPATGLTVGKAGFHGPPDERGMVEVGYAIDPALRRRGYARAALTTMLARAEHEPEVRVVRASISPDNEASLALTAQYGFVQVGDQWDDEDGLELVFERPA